MMQITSLTRTSPGCPAQWEGETSSGERVYIRYRWGSGSVSVADTIEDAVKARYGGPGTIVHEWRSDNEMDGFLTDHELRDLLAGIVSFAAGVIEDPCQQDHDRIGLLACSVCGAEPTEASIEHWERTMGDALRRLKERRSGRR